MSKQKIREYLNDKHGNYSNKLKNIITEIIYKYTKDQSAWVSVDEIEPSSHRGDEGLGYWVAQLNNDGVVFVNRLYYYGDKQWQSLTGYTYPTKGTKYITISSPLPPTQVG